MGGAKSCVNETRFSLLLVLIRTIVCITVYSFMYEHYTLGLLFVPTATRLLTPCIGRFLTSVELGSPVLWRSLLDKKRR
jgi:hypothetical protein